MFKIKSLSQQQKNRLKPPTHFFFFHKETATQASKNQDPFHLTTKYNWGGVDTTTRGIYP